MSSELLFYTGPGSGQFCAFALEEKLIGLMNGNDHRIRKINSLSEIRCDLRSPPTALIVPGGNAAWMERNCHLKNILNTNRISYYGACAGGIFASLNFQERLFDNGVECFSSRKYSMTGLFPGDVIAPLFSKPSDGILSSSDVKIYNVASSAFGEIPTVHILSPGYLDCTNIPRTEILSTYRAQFTGLKFQGNLSVDPARITESLFYQKAPDTSKVLLTGSHPEIYSENVLSSLFKGIFHATNAQQQEIAAQLEESDAIRNQLLKRNFKKLGISCIPD